MEAAEKRKLQKYAWFRQSSPQAEFLPIAFESYGRWGPTALEYLKGLAARMQESGGRGQAFAHEAKARISVALTRGNTRMLLAGVSIGSKAIGHQLRLGCASMSWDSEL